MRRTLAVLCGALVLVTALVWFALRDEEVAETAPPVSPEPTPAAPAETLTSTATTSPIAEAPASDAGERTEVDVDAGDWVVRGRVLTGYDEPRPGAMLLAEILNANLSETLLQEELVADAEGRFRWPLAAPTEGITLRVQGNEPGAKSSTELRGVEPGGPAPQDLEVRVYPRDLTIQGVVRGPDGPLEGALVFWADGRTMTDSEGTYAFDGTSARRDIYLYAQATGYAQVRAVVPAKGNAGEVLRADFDLVPALGVAGRVVDEQGDPVAGAAVETFYAYDNTAVTDAAGRFALDHLDPRRDRHFVYARKDGYVEASVDVESSAGAVDDLELVLRVGTRVEGIVRGPDGAPLPGARLYIGFSPAAYNRLDAETDAEGAFVFPHVDHGQQTLTTEHDDYAPDRRVLTIPEGERYFDPLEVRLARGRAVAGVVRDAGGDPLAGISIAVQQGRDYIEGGTRTDEAGRFRLEDLPVTNLVLEFYSSRTVRKEVRVPDDAAEPLEVVLEATGVVAGRVIDAATGAPIPEFVVRFARPVLREGEEEVGGYSATWVREGKRFTSADGTWSTEGEEIRVGTVLGVEVRAESYGAAIVPHVVVQAEADPDALVIALTPPAAVRGLVVDHLNAPVAGAHVIARPAEASIPSGIEEVHELGIGTTQDDGAFRLDGLPAGELVLYVTPPEGPGFRDGPFAVAPGGEEERIVRVPEGGTLAGLVLAPDGTPRADAWVHLSTPNWMGGWPPYYQAETQSDAEGRFAFSGLPDDRYQVSLVEIVEGETVYDLSVHTEVADGEGFALLQARGTATIRGRVTLDGGPPPALVRVTLRWSEPPGGTRPEEKPPHRSTFARDGVFEIHGVEPGSYMVTCHHGDTLSEIIFGQATAVVGEDETVEVELNLERR